MDQHQIQQVRRFNRTVTQHVGALEDSYLHRGRPLGEARLLHEVGPDGIDVRILRERLKLDSGYISRLLRSLEAQGLVRTRSQRDDARVRRVVLTPKGRAERATYDALSDHASAEERKTLMRRHRTPLLVIGVAVGLLGSAPTLLWVSSAAVIFLFPFVLAGTLWLYVLIFIFSALWFGHFCLRALARLRAERAAPPPAQRPAGPSAGGDIIDLAPSDVRRIEHS